MVATWRHLGFSRALRDFPWRALVFEAHQQDSPAQLQQCPASMETGWNCRPIEVVSFRDGHSEQRGLALLAR